MCKPINARITVYVHSLYALHHHGLQLPQKDLGLYQLQCMHKCTIGFGAAWLEVCIAK